MKTIAGIGSRQTPENILKEIIEIGKWCKSNGIYVNSGHADGCDWHFELGCQEYCVAFIPWKNFNKQLISDAKKIIPDFNERSISLAKQFHPAWENLSYGAKKLIARNSFQVLGSDLEHPVDAVVCWTQYPSGSGGTSQGLRIAKANNIPIINMVEEKFNTAELVIKELSK